MKKKTAIVVISILALAILVGGGIWQWKKGKDSKIVEQNAQQKQTEEIANQEQKDQTGQIALDISNWKTYKNNEYGFSMQYPGNLVAVKNFAVRDQDLSLNLHEGDKKGPLLIMVFASNDVDETLDEKEALNKKIHGEEVSVERINFKGVVALKTKFRGSTQTPPMDQVYLIYNGKSYAFNFGVGGVPNVSEYEDRILDSIIFY